IRAPAAGEPESGCSALPGSSPPVQPPVPRREGAHRAPSRHKTAARPIPGGVPPPCTAPEKSASGLPSDEILYSMQYDEDVNSDDRRPTTDDRGNNRQIRNPR